MQGPMDGDRSGPGLDALARLAFNTRVTMFNDSPTAHHTNYFPAARDDQGDARSVVIEVDCPPKIFASRLSGSPCNNFVVRVVGAPGASRLVNGRLP
jgi:hypothetical protein